MNSTKITKILSQTGNSVYTRFKSDFESLVNIVYLVSNRLMPQIVDTYQQALLDKIQPIQSIPLELDDIQQQLALIWWGIISNRKTNQQSLRPYLLRLSVLELAYWYQRQMKVVLSDDYPLQEEITSLGWLGNLVTPYEGYLLFLRFVQELTIVEITQVLRHDKRTVQKQLKNTIKVLKKELEDVYS